jgi:DNA invertase Pin-like site-specific DNA recombinase
MPIVPLIPVAQYLRMSTELQEYSIDNQAAALDRYAEQHGFTIVQTYRDSGKSGLTIAERSGLKALLKDVLGGQTNYRAILVYDVSRWGRFQDVDEAAYYEFLCKNAGIPVHYVAEPFGTGGGAVNLVLKSLKRTMAAEFSRDLGERVFAGKKRLAAMGFHQAGMAGYGLTRVMVSTGGRKQILQPGEYKSLTTDRVLLVPGTATTTKWIRWIYAQAIKGWQPTEIQRELNRRRVPWQHGRPWTVYAVREILTNPKYAGVNLWGRTASRLHTHPRPNPPEAWVIKHAAWPGVVDEATFDKAQRALRKRTFYESDTTVLRNLKRLLKKRGTITESMIDRSRSVPAVNTLRRRFGGMKRVYRLIGFHPSTMYGRRERAAQQTHRIRKAVIAEIHRTYPGDAMPMQESGRLREVLVFRGLGAMSITVCRSYREPGGLRYWNLFARLCDRSLPTLVCLLSEDNLSVERYYAAPNIDVISKLKLTPRDAWFQRAIRLANLAELRPALQEMADWVPLGLIPRTQGAVALFMGRPQQRTRTHDMERAAPQVPLSPLIERHVERRPPARSKKFLEYSSGHRIEWRTPLAKPLRTLGARLGAAADLPRSRHH